MGTPGTDLTLIGEITLPIAVGTVGGNIKTHPALRYTLALLGTPSSERLARVIASVGLAQNFAAVRALARRGEPTSRPGLTASRLLSADGTCRPSRPVFTPSQPASQPTSQPST